MKPSPPDNARHPFRWSLETLLCFLLAISLAPNSFTFIVSQWTGFSFSLAAPAAAASAVISAYLFTTERIRKFEIRIILLCALMVGYFCITALWSPSHDYMRQKLLYSLTLGPAMLIGGILIGRDDTRIYRFSMGLLLFGLLLTINSLVFGIESLSEYDDFDTETIHAGYQGLSRILALSIIGTITLFLRRHATKTSRVLLFASISAFFLIMLQSGGRTGLAALLGYAVAIVLFRGTQLTRLMIIVGAILLTQFFQSEFLGQWADSAAFDEDLPATIRRLVFYISRHSDYHMFEQSRAFLHQLAIDQFFAHPVFGVGWGGFPIYGGYGDVTNLYPHNMIYEIAAETGLVGLSLLGILLITIIWKAMSVGHRVVIHDNVFGFFGAGLAISMIISDFSTQREFMIFLGLLISTTARLTVTSGSESHLD